MRRRCCCTKAPLNCFNAWDFSGGANSRPGNTMTYSWSGGVYGHYSGVTHTFSQNPNIYAHISPSPASGSVELHYIGSTFGSCVWFGEYPFTISFPSVTIPDDLRSNGAGEWSSSWPCPDQKFPLNFSTLSGMMTFRFVIGSANGGNPGFFQGWGMYDSIRNCYDPLTGNWDFGNAWPTTNQNLASKLDITDFRDCNNDPPVTSLNPIEDCDGFNNDGTPSFLGRSSISNVIGGTPQAIGLAGGRGQFGTIPLADINFGARTALTNYGPRGLVNRFWCAPLEFSCRQNKTNCQSINYSLATSMEGAAPYSFLTGTLSW